MEINDDDTWWNPPKKKKKKDKVFPDFKEHSTICPKCGMEWKGVMSYSCPNMYCPIQPHAIC